MAPASRAREISSVKSLVGFEHHLRLCLSASARCRSSPNSKARSPSILSEGDVGQDAVADGLLPPTSRVRTRRGQRFADGGLSSQPSRHHLDLAQKAAN